MKLSLRFLLSYIIMHNSLHCAAYNPHQRGSETDPQRADFLAGYTKYHTSTDKIAPAIRSGRIAAIEAIDFSRQKITSFHMALAAQKSLAILQYLHTKSGPVDDLHDNLTPTAHAILSFENIPEKAAIIRFLHASGAQVNARLRENATALHLASRSGDLETISTLLALGAHISLQDDRGRTPLHQAIEAQKASAALALIEAKAPLNVKDKQHMTPLHHAAKTGQMALYYTLLERRAEPSLDLSRKLPSDYLPKEERDRALEKERKISETFCKKLMDDMWNEGL